MESVRVNRGHQEQTGGFPGVQGKEFIHFQHQRKLLYVQKDWLTSPVVVTSYQTRYQKSTTACEIKTGQVC